MRMRTIAPILGIMMIAAGIVGAGTQARIAGRVTDTSGKPIAGATVTVSSVDVAAFEKVLTTDKEGEFKLLLLDATQRYKLRVEAPGFQSQERPFKVGVGSSDAFFELPLASVEQAQAASTKDLIEQPGYTEMTEGRKLYQAGDLRGALAQFEAAVAARPDLAPAVAAVADIHFELGEYQEALEAARRCLEVDDDSLDCLGTAANAASEVGDEAARMQYLARYQELNPEDPAVLFNNAAIFLNKLDDQGARPLLEQCLESNPDFPQCNFEYGMLLLRAGDMEGAKKHLEKYLEVAPNGSEAATARETLKYL